MLVKFKINLRCLGLKMQRNEIYKNIGELIEVKRRTEIEIKSIDNEIRNLKLLQNNRARLESEISEIKNEIFEEQKRLNRVNISLQNLRVRKLKI